MAEELLAAAGGGDVDLVAGAHQGQLGIAHRAADLEGLRGGEHDGVGEVALCVVARGGLARRGAGGERAGAGRRRTDRLPVGDVHLLDHPVDRGDELGAGDVVLRAADLGLVGDDLGLVLLDGARDLAVDQRRELGEAVLVVGLRLGEGARGVMGGLVGVGLGDGDLVAVGLLGVREGDLGVLQLDDRGVEVALGGVGVLGGGRLRLGQLLSSLLHLRRLLGAGVGHVDLRGVDAGLEA